MSICQCPVITIAYTSLLDTVHKMRIPLHFATSPNSLPFRSSPLCNIRFAPQSHKIHSIRLHLLPQQPFLTASRPYSAAAASPPELSAVFKAWLNVSVTTLSDCGPKLPTGEVGTTTGLLAESRPLLSGGDDARAMV